MPLPEDFYDEDTTYMVRICMLVDDTNDPSSGSKIHQCASCDALIWVDEDQEVPPAPEGKTLNGCVNVCRLCMRKISKSDGAEIDLLNELPPEMRGALMKFFGLE